MNRALRPWTRRDQRSVRSHQALVDAVNGVATVSPTGDLAVAANPFGVGIIDNRPFTFLDVRLAKLIAFGPPPDRSAYVGEEPAGDSLPDWTDERYWAAFCVPDPAYDGTAVELRRSPPADVSQAGPDLPAGQHYQYPYPVVVTNLAETAGHTHLLPTDGTCEVIVLLVRDHPVPGDATRVGTSDRWVMRVEPPAVKLGTVAAAWTPGDPSVSVTPDGGTSPADDVDVTIELPGGTVAPISFASDAGDQVAYAEVGDVRFLVSYRRFAASTTQYDYLGNAGADAAACNFIPMPIKAT